MSWKESQGMEKEAESKSEGRKGEGKELGQR